jgi:hypothetical protein
MAIEAMKQIRRKLWEAACTPHSATLVFCLFLLAVMTTMPAVNGFSYQVSTSVSSSSSLRFMRVRDVVPISSMGSLQHMPSSTTSPKNSISRGTYRTLSLLPPSNNNYNDIGRKNNEEEEEEDEFWRQQRQLVQDMTRKTELSLKREQLTQFQQTQSKLIQETTLVSSLLFAVLWLACDNPLIPFSFVFGALFGLAYTYGLGKYVETLGGTVDDTLTVQGAGVGQARFAFLVLLLVLVGKLRDSVGLMEIPSILGFFTYQIASLTQGLREE